MARSSSQEVPSASVPTASSSRSSPNAMVRLASGVFRSWLTRPANVDNRSLETARARLRQDSSSTSTIRSARVASAATWEASSSRVCSSKTHRVPMVTPVRVTSLCEA
ncbi:hypothetical protein BH11ACT8_BH11ACT8_11660 [soil metagenome]